VRSGRALLGMSPPNGHDEEPVREHDVIQSYMTPVLRILDAQPICQVYRVDTPLQQCHHTDQQGHVCPGPGHNYIRVTPLTGENDGSESHRVHIHRPSCQTLLRIGAASAMIPASTNRTLPRGGSVTPWWRVRDITRSVDPGELLQIGGPKPPKPPVRRSPSGEIRRCHG
jgi:hypothetical protein